jgi:DNA (cytosine-5)-methyltransferase 1
MHDHAMPVTIENGRYFMAILKKLEDLATYRIQHRVLNTKEHGVPQNRPRVYIICIRKDVDDGSFILDDLQPLPTPSIEMFLDKRKPSQVTGLPPVRNGNGRRNVLHHLAAIRKTTGDDPFTVPYVIDDGSTLERSTAKKDCCPCITRRRGAGHWVSNRGRRLLKTEMARLQGMDPTRFVVAVRPTMLGEQLGNTMSVNILERLFCRILPAAGLAKRGKPLPDRWESGRALKKIQTTRGKDFKRYVGNGVEGQPSPKRTRKSLSMVMNNGARDCMGLLWYLVM